MSQFVINHSIHTFVSLGALRGGGEESEGTEQKTNKQYPILFFS